MSNTVHVYYEISNGNGKLSPGQRVGVTLPLITESNSLVVPWGAVLYDIHGTTWVYEKSAENVFRRRRVFVAYSHDNWAVLASVPPARTVVCVHGRADMFGLVSGAGK